MAEVVWLDSGYARDANSVFFHSMRSQKIDRATFRALNANFGVDSSHAYFVVTPIKDADPQTFRVLDSSYIPRLDWFSNGGYVADVNSVWFASKNGIYRIKNADPKTFVSLGNGFGYDHQNVYYENAQLPGADRATWRVWRGNLSVDRDSVFFTNKKIADVDRPSIWLLTPHGCFMDRHRVYSNGVPISIEQYFECCLKFSAEHCAWERDWLSNGKLFERILDEWPKHE
ncbi:MAG TPA: DKNYY domain-containing protein [Verrucomicrobiae bacterium]|nr:DKNYY domain-containing protein [Verrucomicrobiae bacterium]